MIRVSTALIALATATGLTACGGEDPDDFRAELDAYCVEQAEATVAALEPLGGPRAAADFEESVAQSEATLPVREEDVSGLQDFEPPSELEEGLGEYVAAKEEALAAGEDAVAAAGEGDEQAYQEALAENQEATDEARAAAEEMGLVDCAGQLPAAEEDEVRALLERVATTSDPSQCSEDFTESYLESNFGRKVGDESADPLVACEEYQASPEGQELPDSIEISEITGTRPSVTVVAVDSGGPNDGEELTHRVVEEDGAWKINDIVIAPPQ